MGPPLRVGLNYPSVKVCLDMLTDMTHAERMTLFEDVRLMERAALEGMSGKAFANPFHDPPETIEDA